MRLALLLALLLAACTPGPLAVLAPPAGRIAFIGAEGDLFTVRADGSDARRLTHLGEPEDAARRSAHFWPTWSPDGRRIAVAGTDVVDGDLAGAGLYAVPAAGGPAQELYAATDTLPFFYAWAPDGHAIAVLTTDGGAVVLHLRAADGSGGQPLVAARPLYLAWAPDGRSVAVHLNGDAALNPEAGVFVLPAEGAAGAGQGAAGAGQAVPLPPT